jgi:hypothetical protein
VATDLLFVPVLWALYAVLKNVNRTMMLAGTSLVALFIVLDLAITWPNYAVHHPRSLTIDHCWRDVAEACLSWLKQQSV